MANFLGHAFFNLFTPRKLTYFPNQWLEDEIAFLNGRFLGDVIIFGGGGGMFFFVCILKRNVSSVW